jgi:hypothetical protein
VIQNTHFAPIVAHVTSKVVPALVIGISKEPIAVKEQIFLNTLAIRTDSL